MKKQLIRAAATTVLGLSLTTGFAAADISNTGPSSKNIEKSHTSNSATIDNHNSVSGSNHNAQSANSGSAEAEHNTTAGGAASGNASNSNSLSATVAVNNSAGTSGLSMPSSAPSNPGNIDTTGPNSVNVVKSSVKNTLRVTNTNDVHFDNSNCQTASTGNAEVEGNTTGGSATTGSASNSNSSTFNFSVTN